MKTILQSCSLFIALIISISLLQSCDKPPTEPDDDTTDTTEVDTTTNVMVDSVIYSFTEIWQDSIFVADVLNENPQTQAFLIEEFTGVRCVNCPKGHEVTDEILSLYPNMVQAVGIHAGSLATPYPESLHDFRTDNGEYIHDFFNVSGTPSAMINRHFFMPDFSMVLYNKNQWQDKLEQLMEENNEAPINLYVYHTFDEATRIANIYVQTICTQSLDANIDYKLSVAISENDIIDRQITEDGIVEEYTHKHVLRHTLSPNEAWTIGSTAQNTVFVKALAAFEVPNDWNIDNLNILAFVHKNTDDDKEILQVAEAKLVE
ncbi:MAG: Omp28-related outer membrane protein [Chitinophagales bacterium]